MMFKDWLEKHQIRAETVERKLAQLAGENGNTIFAIRKWMRGERIPRPKMQAAIMDLTGGAVTPNDWVLGPKKKGTHSKRSNHRLGAK